MKEQYPPEHFEEEQGPKRFVYLEDLAVCECECDMRFATGWKPLDEEFDDLPDPRHYLGDLRIELHCPNCEEPDQGIADAELSEKFMCLLDRGTDSLVRDLKNLTFANMATEINVFSGALDADKILPEDFNFRPSPEGDPLVEDFYKLLPYDLSNSAPLK